MARYSEAEQDVLREGGRRLAVVMERIIAGVHTGVTTSELNDVAGELIKAGGDFPAFLNYTPAGASRPYPAVVCTSVNNEVVHGIPTEHPRVLAEGDIITIDIGLVHNDLVVDMAVTVPVGKLDEKTTRLIKAAKEARVAGIAVARHANTTGDIGSAVERIATSHGFSVVKELGGHGVGRSVHEEPFIPNFGTPGKGERLEAGMVLAIEPILSEGSGEVFLGEDGYTYKTKDNSRTAQFEHTVLVTDGEPEILTIV